MTLFDLNATPFDLEAKSLDLDPTPFDLDPRSFELDVTLFDLEARSFDLDARLFDLDAAPVVVTESMGRRDAGGPRGASSKRWGIIEQSWLYPTF